MAENLMKNGHSLVVHDVNAAAVERAVAAGASAAATPAELAAQVETVVTMLPNSTHVLEVYAGTAGLLSTVSRGALMLDSSTIAPDVSRQLAAKAEKAGARFLDCPVSGGVNASKAGSLTFMVGGAEADMAAARAVLGCMGGNIVHCGAAGSGQAAKICNNMLLAVTMIGVSETMNLGVRLGLEPALLASILNSSSGRCWASDTYNPVPGVMPTVPSSNGYQGGFGTALMTKDLGLAQEAATSSQTPTPLGSLAHQIYRILTTSGYAEKDFSSVYQFLKEQEGGK